MHLPLVTRAAPTVPRIPRKDYRGPQPVADVTASYLVSNDEVVCHFMYSSIVSTLGNLMLLFNWLGILFLPEVSLAIGGVVWLITCEASLQPTQLIRPPQPSNRIHIIRSSPSNVTHLPRFKESPI
jgi:hypothetical protein